MNLERKFFPRLFLRTSRPILANVDRIKGIQSGPRGEYLVILQDGRQLLMTRRPRHSTGTGYGAEHAARSTARAIPVYSKSTPEPSSAGTSPRHTRPSFEDEDDNA